MTVKCAEERRLQVMAPMATKASNDRQYFSLFSKRRMVGRDDGNKVRYLWSTWFTTTREPGAKTNNHGE